MAVLTIRDALNQAVAAGTMTPAQAKDRWNEAKEVANIAVSEANAQQRSEESALNASITVSSQRQDAMQTSTNNALEFVSKINGYLPTGSNLGGQAFAALLGLQMLQANLSGINNINPNAPKLPTLTPADLTNRSMLEAKRNEIGAQVAAAASPPPVRDDWRTQPSQPAPAVAPVAPALPNPLAVAAASPLPMQADGNERATDILTVQPPGGPDEPTQQMTRAQYDALTPPQRAVLHVVNAQAGPPQPVAAPSVPPSTSPPVPSPSGINRTGGGDVTPGGDPEMPAGAGVLQQPGEMIPGGGTVQKAMPPMEWQALASFAPPSQPGAPAPSREPQAGPPDDFGNSPAMLRARAASRPPWQMSEEELQGYLDAGVPPEVVWGVPGRQVA